MNIYGKEVEKTYKELLVTEEKRKIVLDLKKFNPKEKVIKNRIILYTINKLLGTSKNIEMIHIADICKLCEKNIGNKYLIPNKKVKVSVNKGLIFFEENL